jgi:CheY-like chemotaxis protein
MPAAKHDPLVLIVDDDPLIRLDLSGTLHDAGYRTAEAANAEEASQSLRAEKPELIITDVYMRQPAEGLGLIRRVRATDPAIKIIAISGHEFRRYEVLDRAEQNGADGSLAKPIHRFELLDLVERLLPLDRGVPRIRA